MGDWRDADRSQINEETDAVVELEQAQYFEYPYRISSENFVRALRSGLTNLNSTLSGNSGHDVGLERVWRKGVFDGQEEIAGCKEAAAQA